ncbi:transcription elongation factor spt4 [Ceratobasidium sp. 395]|nr:transcription elongation factor spt4 [Ceratobasidium sp. 395]
MATIPANAKNRNLRACLLCSIIQTAQDFKREGCPNCDEILQLKGSQENVQHRTSATFDGIIALMNPEESWVGRWQRVHKYVKGMYAVRVSGRVPEDVMDDLQSRGITYRPRDQLENS